MDKIKELEAQIKYMEDKYVRAASEIFGCEEKITVLQGIIDEMRILGEFYGKRENWRAVTKTPDREIFGFFEDDVCGDMARETLASVDKKLKGLI